MQWCRHFKRLFGGNGIPPAGHVRNVAMGESMEDKNAQCWVELRKIALDQKKVDLIILMMNIVDMVEAKNENLEQPKS